MSFFISFMSVASEDLEPGSLLLFCLFPFPLRSLWRIMNGQRCLESVDGLNKLDAHRGVYQKTSMEPRIKSTSLYLNNTQRMHKQNKTKSTNASSQASAGIFIFSSFIFRSHSFLTGTLGPRLFFELPVAFMKMSK